MRAPRIADRRESLRLRHSAFRAGVEGTKERRPEEGPLDLRGRCIVCKLAKTHLDGAKWTT